MRKDPANKEVPIHLEIFTVYSKKTEKDRQFLFTAKITEQG